MIVKNQEESIRDTLQSVSKYADAAFFMDTGSTDWTICSAEEWLKNTGTPGIVLDYHDRMGPLPQAAITEAQKFLQSEHFSLDDTYFFLLGGDTRVEFAANFDKKSLKGDAYLIFEASSLLKTSFYEPLIFRSSLPKNPSPPEKLPQVRIASGDTDFLYQINHLIEAVEKNPKNGKALFQLAHWLRAGHQFEEAISCYQKRMDLGGDKEELWFCKFMTGACYDELGDRETALSYYLEAFQMRPQYPDPIQKIAAHYRLSSEDEIAYLFASRGALINRSLDQHFFDYPPLQDYQFNEEISITAYYTRYQNEGLLAAGKLSLSKNVPSWIKDQNNRNLFYYTPNLKNTHFKKLEIDLPLISKKSEERYRPINLSLLKTREGFKLVCGSTNYTQTGGRTHHTNDPKGIFRTRNFLLRTDPDFKIVSQQEVIENLPRDRFRPFNMEGLEDCRLFRYQGSDWLTCTTLDTNETGCCQVSLCKLPNDLSSPEILIDELIPLPGPDPHQNEKNWLPFIQDECLKFIYSYDPLIFFSFHPETKTCTPAASQESCLDLSRLRGSAPPIPFDNGHLMVAHTAVHYPDATKAYLHYFLYLDSSFQLTHISHPFVFQHQGIEKCYSICLDHSEKKLIIPVGIEDQEIYLCTIDVESVRPLLIPVDLFINSPNPIP